MKVILVAYYFPPFGGAGAQRPLKLAKYWSAAGYKVTIVAPSRDDSEHRFSTQDDSLADELNEIADRINLIRCEPKSSRSFSIDKYEGWAVSAAEVVESLLQQSRFDFVFLTMSPFSLIRVADRASLYDVRVALDLRDPWAFDGWQRHRTYFHWRRQLSEMRRALLAADLVVANTPESKKTFLSEFQGLESDRVVVSPNGFDEDDFGTTSYRRKKWQPNDQIEVLFTGTLLTREAKTPTSLFERAKKFVSYSPESLDASGRTLVHLADALTMFFERHGRQPFAVKCLGTYTNEDEASVASVRDYFKFEGYVPHRSMIEHLLAADCLFLPLHGVVKDRRSLIVPGKTYEYLASGRPILGCLPPGDARELVERSHVGVTCDPTSAEDIVRGLEIMERLINKESKVYQREPWVAEYARKNLAERLGLRLMEIAHS